MKEFTFTKMTGAGNDFIIFDTSIDPDFKVNPDIVRQICDRRYGIGADGVIVINDEKEYDFSMKYYNADGSAGTLCGNGARCSIKYAQYSARLSKREVQFTCEGIEYSGEVLENGLIKFDLKDPQKIKLNFKIKAFGQMINASYVDTGSPHVVILTNDILKDAGKIGSNFNHVDELPLYEIGREIRHSKDFSPSGTNVNFIEIFQGGLKIRTYERGVENETYACGTGAAASAVVANMNYKLPPPVELVTRGGDKLKVDFSESGGKIRNLSLTGPAKIVFKGNIILPN